MKQMALALLLTPALALAQPSWQSSEPTTDEPVELEFDGRVINATGMQANLETNELKLLADVNGKFMP